MQESFLSFLKRKTNKEFKGSRFPSSAEANQWMTNKVDHMIKNDPENAHHLFSPASGEYMPRAVHVGSSWKNEHQNHYRELKKKHPELVAKAKKVTTGIAGQVSLSKVGDEQDFYGMKVSE